MARQPIKLIPDAEDSMKKDSAPHDLRSRRSRRRSEKNKGQRDKQIEIKIYIAS